MHASAGTSIHADTVQQRKRKERLKQHCDMEIIMSTVKSQS